MTEKSHDLQSLMTQIAADADTSHQLAQLPGTVLRPANINQYVSSPALALSTQPPPALHFRLPVVGTIVTGLGEETQPGVRARGLTLAPQPDAVVVAPSAGQIVFAGPYRDYGQIVIIDHGNGITSLITNLAQLSAHVGATVIAGSPLGRAAHVQPTITIEVRRGNTPIDVASLLS